MPRSTLHEWEGKYGGLRVSTTLFHKRFPPPFVFWNVPERVTSASEQVIERIF